MITWPDPKSLTDDAQRHIEAFRRTSLAKELEEAEHAWTLVSWARMPDPPARMILRSVEGQQIVCTLDQGGLWTQQRAGA